MQKIFKWYYFICKKSLNGIILNVKFLFLNNYKIL